MLRRFILFYFTNTFYNSSNKVEKIFLSHIHTYTNKELDDTKIVNPLEKTPFNIEEFFLYVLNEIYMSNRNFQINLPVENSLKQNGKLLNLLLLNILEFISFLVVSLLLRNIKVILAFSLLHIFLIFYNTFFTGEILINFITIGLILLFLFFFGTSHILFIISVMIGFRLFVNLLVFYKLYVACKK